MDYSSRIRQFVDVFLYWENKTHKKSLCVSLSLSLSQLDIVNNVVFQIVILVILVRKSLKNAGCLHLTLGNGNDLIFSMRQVSLTCYVLPMCMLSLYMSNIHTTSIYIYID